MTDRQPEEDFLADLLQRSERTEALGAAPDASRDPSLPADDELALLKRANEVGTPVLVPPAESPATSVAHQAAPPGEAPTSFGAEIAAIVRRYPIPALLFSAGLVYLLTRRRR